MDHRALRSKPFCGASFATQSKDLQLGFRVKLCFGSNYRVEGFWGFGLLSSLSLQIPTE